MSTKRSIRMPEKVQKGPLKLMFVKGPLECIKSPLDKLMVKKSSRGSEQFKSNQLGHACSKITIIIQRKVHFLCKELPTC